MNKEIKQGTKCQVDIAGIRYNAEVFFHNKRTDLVTLNLPRGVREDGTFQVESEFILFPPPKRKKA
jgi:hypothetical protein